MVVIINVNGCCEEEEEEDKQSFCDKCFHFWGEEHPLCLMWIFILFIGTLSVGISEYSKQI